MEQKSLEQLRSMARNAGISGAARLSKKQLIERLKKLKARAPKKNARRDSTTKTRKSAQSKSRKDTRKTTARTRSGARTSATLAPIAQYLNNIEEHIESAKFEIAPPNTSFAFPHISITDLQENIDQLPAINESVLCLLPQKPGVVYAYWILREEEQHKPLRIRLCCATEDAIAVLDEIKVSGGRGHWYFHVPETTDAGQFVAQIGYYDAKGNFVTAIHRGIARIPNLYASSHTDRSWWVNDELFRTMYLRAGGMTRGGRLGWAGSTSSLGGAIIERLAWPSGLNSSQA